MTWIESLAAHITTASLGEPGVTLFVGDMDDTLDQTEAVAALSMQNGNTLETLGDGGIAIDMPVLQVSVRAKSYVEASNRINDIRDLLKTIKNETVEGTKFLRVSPSGTPRDLGRDDRGRKMFTAEFDVWI